jgi:putative ABC transport system permease protein
MSEYLRSALDGIWAHKLRSMLTMLGIIIGIASIIAISSTIMGTNEQIKQNLIGAGNNTVTIKLYQGDYEMQLEYEQVPEGVPILDASILKEIREISEVEDAALFYKRNAWQAVYHGETGLSQGTILGVDENYMDVYGYQLRAGRSFVPEDFSEYRKVALIDKSASDTLFLGQNPIGQTVEIKGEPYIIVGEIAQSAAFTPVINTIDEYYTYMDSSGGKVLIPIGTWPVIYKYDEPVSLVVRARNTEAMTEAGKKAAAVLNGRFTKDTGEVKYASDDLLERAKQLQELSSATNRQLIWIASISLLVGGIGVMNIMLVSVTERTREIGLKKALGARRRVISLQFLTEAGVLTCIGGVLGVIVGVALAFIVSKISQVPIFISGYIIVAAVVFSFVVGLFFGAVPAIQASKLNPIEALRHE